MAQDTEGERSNLFDSKREEISLREGTREKGRETHKGRSRGGCPAASSRQEGYCCGVNTRMGQDNLYT